MPRVTASGTRYSIHDHLFDFSQPEMSCSECHDQSYEGTGMVPRHKWNIQTVRIPKDMTTQEACLRCHPDKDPTWVAEKIKILKFRL